MTTETSTSAFPSLVNERFVSLVTFRKDGTAVATPMWFAERERTIYMATGSSLAKVKRIRRTPRVTLAPCTNSGKVTGAALECRARMVSDAAEKARAEEALDKKYGMPRRILYFLMGVASKLNRKAPSRDTYIAVEPVLIAEG